jgi:Caspase domain
MRFLVSSALQRVAVFVGVSTGALLAGSSVEARPKEAGDSEVRGMSVKARSAPKPGRLASLTPPVQRALQRYQRRVALTIGISAYSKSWPALKAAASDAEHIADLFKTMGFDDVVSLEEDDSTREGILRALEQDLPAFIGKEDLVVIFFAGHGATAGQEGYLVARDSNQDLEETAISLERLRSAALGMNNRHTIYLIDACFSGAALQRTPVAQNSLAHWDAAAEDRIVQILTAGQKDEPAHERNGWGLFTRALHDGLSGAADRDGDRVITFEELARSVQAQVVLSSGGRQHPQWKTMEGFGSALLLDARILPKAPQQSPEKAPPVAPHLKAKIAQVRRLMSRHEWAEAEELLQTLWSDRDECEFRLLLVEIFLGRDALGYSELIEREFVRVTEGRCTDAQHKRVAGLRKRLGEVRREH